MGALQQETFDVWREEHAKQMEQLLKHAETQTALNLASEKRIATVEEKQATQERRGAWITAIVSAIVGGLVGGVAGRQ